MKSFNVLLYVIIDIPSIGNNSLTPLVTQVLNGEATVVQLRDKTTSDSQLLRVGQVVHKITKAYGIPLIINDRVMVAKHLDADGVHIGQSDMPIETARKILGYTKVIGLSVKTVAQALIAQREGADYLGVGPVFGTNTKPDAGRPIGLKRLSEIAKSVSIPVVGIGGITIDNAASVISAGASGVAVISAILQAKDPKGAAYKLSKLVATRNTS